MARRKLSLLLRPSLLQTLIQCHPTRTPPLHSPASLPSLGVPSPSQPSPPPPLFFSRRSFSSSPGPSGFVIVNSEEEFNNSLKKVQEGGLPAIFYFTAVWCGPCKFISPIIEELSKKYPNVTVNKIDIDLEDLRSTLSKLNISAVPTLYFFRDGKKVAEVIGADIAKLKDTMEELYKKD